MALPSKIFEIKMTDTSH